MDKIAPLKIKSAADKRKAPWLNNKTVKQLKKQCRRAECKWTKTKLHIHYEIYRDNLVNYNMVTKTARQLFFLTNNKQ